MIKVNKNLNIVPNSLNDALTNQRREELIQAKAYPTPKTVSTNSAFTVTVSSYNSRYKLDDIKIILEFIYYFKCVYCEQRIEGYHIEHYRPKSIYYWLAYSWDNLLFCCSKCNSHKLNHFNVKKRVSINDLSITDIHNLRDIYDKYEQPQLVNPEKENIYKYLIYNKDGNISSHDARTQYTIDTCKLDRQPLNDWRRRIYDDFEEEIIIFIGIIGNKNASLEAKQKATIELESHITSFVKTMNNPNSEFTTFRKYIFKNWLKTLYKSY